MWMRVSKEYMEEMLAGADNGDEQGSLDDDLEERTRPSFHALCAFGQLSHLNPWAFAGGEESEERQELEGKLLRTAGAQHTQRATP